MNGTASLTEFGSIVVNFLGVVLVIYLYDRTKAQYEALGDDTTSELERMAAWRHFRCQSERVVYHLGSLAFGFWAMMLPDSMSWYGQSLMTFRFLLGVMLLVWSILDVRCDRRMWTLMRRQGRRR